MTIKTEFVAEVLRQTLEIKRKNKIGRKALRSYNGSVGHIAHLVWAMKPFMEELWAAAEQRPKSNAGRGLVWKRQIDLAITWVLAFLRQQNGPLRRQWRLSSMMADSARVTITFDASPWGLGCVLFLDGWPAAYIFSAISAHAVRRYHATVGDHRFQLLFEALAVLVALQCWRRHWIS